MFKSFSLNPIRTFEKVGKLRFYRSHLNTKVKQNCARTVLVWESTLKILVKQALVQIMMLLPGERTRTNPDPPFVDVWWCLCYSYPRADKCLKSYYNLCLLQQMQVGSFVGQCLKHSSEHIPCNREALGSNPAGLTVDVLTWHLSILSVVRP